jgi:hypothetical protein
MTSGPDEEPNPNAAGYPGYWIELGTVSQDFGGGAYIQTNLFFQRMS